ncbi:MAG: hypothetical protein ACTSVU_09065 [Promethearchaeota archaeon]
MDNKQLYKISKYCYRENLLQYVLENSGTNLAKVQEKMARNPKYIKNQGIMMKITLFLYLLMLITVPIQVFLKINTAINQEISTDWILFSGSLSIGIFFLIQSSFLVLFGMFQIGGLMSGEPFKWLVSLPLTKIELEKISFFTFFRALSVSVISIVLVPPIALALITQSILITFSSLILSILNIIISFGILVIIGEKFSRIMKINEANDKRSNLTRFLWMIIYIVMVLTISIGIQFALPAISDFILNPNLHIIPVISSINQWISWIPIGISQGYLLIGIHLGIPFTSQILLEAILGILLLLLVGYKIISLAISKLNSVISEVEIKKTIQNKEINKNDIQVSVVNPVNAFFKRDKSMASRDYQISMMVFMCTIFPLLSLIFKAIGGEDFQDIGVLLSIFLIYLIMSASMLIMSIIHIESSGSTINAALPIKVRDQAKSKLKWIFTILPTSLGLWWLFQIGSPDFWAITITTLICLPIGPLIAIFNMIITVRMFGKIKNKYVLEEINIRWKFWKYLSIIIFDIIVYIGLMILFLVNYNSAGIGKIAMILVPIEGILSAIAYFLFNWIFPKQNNYY